MPDDYDAQDDLAKSLAVGYKAIRERQAKGGPGWLPAKRAKQATAVIIAASVLEKVAKRIKNPEMLRDALLAKLAAQREFAGGYRAEFPDGGDRRSLEFQTDTSVGLKSDQWCMSYGFHVRTVQRWLILIEEETFEQRNAAIFKRYWELAELWQAANYSSESVEWYTPKHYLDAVREVLGEIDLDPASSPDANVAVAAKEFFTKDQDGLGKEWHGRVFMNPPYGKTSDNKSLAAEFCNKAISEYQSGNVEACIILVNSLHSQTWQAPLYDHLVCFVKERIQFVSGDGEENKNPTFQNIFVYLGKDEPKFAGIFSKLGYVMRRVVV